MDLLGTLFPLDGVKVDELQTTRSFHASVWEVKY